MMADGNTLLYVDAVDIWHVWKSSTSKHFFNALQEVDAAKNNQICLGELLAMPTIDANASLFSKDNCSSPCNWTCNFSKRKTERGIYPALPCIAIVHYPQTWRFPGFLRSLMMSIPWCWRHEMNDYLKSPATFCFMDFLFGWPCLTCQDQWLMDTCIFTAHIQDNRIHSCFKSFFLVNLGIQAWMSMEKCLKSINDSPQKNIVVFWSSHAQKNGCTMLKNQTKSDTWGS